MAQSFSVQRISRECYLYETNVPEDTWEFSQVLSLCGDSLENISHVSSSLESPGTNVDLIPNSADGMINHVSHAFSRAPSAEMYNTQIKGDMQQKKGTEFFFQTVNTTLFLCLLRIAHMFL